MKINQRLFPVKAHYFFFMAAMGPILPQMTVFGKQLGISTVVMGSVTAVLPILFLLAKPAFGFLADYFLNHRKSIFVGLIIATCVSFSLLSVLPKPLNLNEDNFNFTSTTLNKRICGSGIISNYSECLPHQQVPCVWNCTAVSENEHNTTPILYNNEIQETCYLGKTQTVECYSNSTHSCDQQDRCAWNYTGVSGNEHGTTLILYKNNESPEACYLGKTQTAECYSNSTCYCDLLCDFSMKTSHPCLQPVTFWSFVLFISIGCIGFNVANCISDAICFDVLGVNGEMGYGMQRVWGTIGFGLSALLSGYFIDYVSDGDIKNYTPMYITIIVMTVFDLISCKNLKLPKLQTSDNIFKDLRELLKHAHIVIFLIFATLVGIVDSFVVFFLFWYLEDLASETQNMQQIKFLEGLTVAAETLGGEVIFFVISGKILKKLGYGHSFTLCFLFYGLRLGLISFLTSPWWILPIEFVMQGPTYAMSYTTIVAYTSAVSPPGTSATMQGIAAGMDDGFGYAVGSLIGGILYKYLGGKGALRIFSSIAILCGIIHFILYITILRKSIPKIGEREKEVEYKTPNEAFETTQNLS